MAIAFLGYETFKDSDGTWSNTATLPAGTDCVLIFLLGYDDPNPSVTSISLGGASLGAVDIQDVNASYYSSFLYHQIAPGTGTKTFACVMASGAWLGGGYAVLIYLSGVDQATPIRHSLANHTTSAGTTLSLTLTSVTDDVCVIAAVEDNTVAIDVDLNSQTKIFEDTSSFNASLWAGAYKSATGATCLMQAAGDFVAGAACSLIPAASGGGGGHIEIQDRYSKIQLETADALLLEDANTLLTEEAVTATTDDILLEDGTTFLGLEEGAVDLAADGIDVGAPVLGTPTLTQVHALAGSGLTATPTLGTPTLSQVHALSGNGLAAGAPVLGTPAISQNHALTANGITTGVPVLGTPAIPVLVAKFGNNFTIAGTTMIYGYSPMTSGVTAADQAIACLFTTPANCTSIKSIADVHNTSVFGQVACIWATDGTLLGSKKIAGDSVDGYHRYTFDSPVNVSANTQYYFGFIYEGAVTIWYETSPSNLERAGTGSYATPGALTGTDYGNELGWFMEYSPTDGDYSFSMPFVRDFESHPDPAFGFDAKFGDPAYVERVGAAAAHGNYGLKITLGSGISYRFVDVLLDPSHVMPPRVDGNGLTGRIYARLYVKLSAGFALDTMGREFYLATLHNSIDEVIAAIGVKAQDGTTADRWMFNLRPLGSTLTVTGFSLNAWHYLEIWCDFGSNPGSYGYIVDGTTVETGSAADLSTIPGAVELAFGAWVGGDATPFVAGDIIYLDDMKISTTGPIGAEGEVYSLTANGIDAGAPVLGTPSLSQTHALTGNGSAAGAPALGTPSVSQTHALTASGSTTTPVLGTPTLHQDHALTASGISTTPQLSSPVISQLHVLTGSGIVTGAPVLGTPTLTQNSGEDALTASDLTASAAVLGEPFLSQDHALIADGIQAGLPQLGAPELAQIHQLVADGIIAGPPVLGSPWFINPIAPPTRVHLYFSSCQTLSLPAAVAEVALDFHVTLEFSTPPLRDIALDFQAATEVAL